MESFESSLNQSTENMGKSLNSLIQEKSAIELHNAKSLNEIQIGENTFKKDDVLHFALLGPGKDESQKDWRILEIRQPENPNDDNHNYSEDLTEVIFVNSKKDAGFTEDDVQIRTSKQLDWIKGNIKLADKN